MKILVTGAAGFIGYHLIKNLLQKNLVVVGIDNINDYYDINLKFARLSNLGIIRASITEDGDLVKSTNNSNFSFGKINIVNLSKLKVLFKTEKFTHIINLAAQAGVRHSIENPHVYIQSNVVGFVNLLECSRHNKIKHFLYASSSSVYGTNSKIPFSEKDRVDTPVSIYAATKKSNELMAYTYSHLYDLPTTGLRFFTVYGPWGRPDMAPMLFASAILKGEPINVFNNGDMQRDFTYIDDIIEGIVKVIYKQPDNNPKADLFNIGNSKPVDLMKFISILGKEIAIEPILNFCPMQDGDVKRTYADTSLLNKLTGYKSNIDLGEGVKLFVQWFKEYNY